MNWGVFAFKELFCKYFIYLNRRLFKKRFLWSYIFPLPSRGFFHIVRKYTDAFVFFLFQMHILRTKLTTTLQSFMDADDQQVCILYGPRQAGKTTLLKQLYTDMVRGRKKSYFSFDEDIVPRQFIDLDEFLSRMLLKF